MSVRVHFGPVQHAVAGDAASLRAAMLAQARQLIEGLARDAGAVGARQRTTRGGGWQVVHR